MIDQFAVKLSGEALIRAVGVFFRVRARRARIAGAYRGFSHLAQWARKFSAVLGTVSQKISILMSPNEVSSVTDIVLIPGRSGTPSGRQTG